MNTMTDGTTYRSTPAGIVAIRGSRELHLLGTSVESTAKARRMLAVHSFDKLYKAGRGTSLMPRVRSIKMGG